MKSVLLFTLFCSISVLASTQCPDISGAFVECDDGEGLSVYDGENVNVSFSRLNNVDTYSIAKADQTIKYELITNNIETEVSGE